MTEFVGAENVLRIYVELDSTSIDMLAAGKTVWLDKVCTASEQKIVVSVYCSDCSDEGVR